MNYTYNKFCNYKKALLLLATCTLFTACDINSDMRALSANKGDSNARTIAASNGCMGCHSVSNKVVGPAWKRVAQRYKNTPDARTLLIEKIKSGGKGNWDNETGGETMPSFEGKISDEDLSVLVEYILELGKQQK